MKRLLVVSVFSIWGSLGWAQSCEPKIDFSKADNKKLLEALCSSDIDAQRALITSLGLVDGSSTHLKRLLFTLNELSLNDGDIEEMQARRLSSLFTADPMLLAFLRLQVARASFPPTVIASWCSWKKGTEKQLDLSVPDDLTIWKIDQGLSCGVR